MKATLLFCSTPAPAYPVSCSIINDRLQRSTEQQAAEGGASNDAAGAAAAAAGPSVSFFGLIKEGRLSRNQAATLFYQVCGESCRPQGGKVTPVTSCPRGTQDV